MSNFTNNLNRILTEQRVNKSKMIEELGISRTAYYDYLSDRRQMNTDMVEKYAEYLGVSPAVFFENSELARLKNRVFALENQVKELQEMIEKQLQKQT